MDKTFEETVDKDPVTKPAEQSGNMKITEEEINEISTEPEAEQVENPTNESENMILNDEFCLDSDFTEN